MDEIMKEGKSEIETLKNDLDKLENIVASLSITVRELRLGLINAEDNIHRMRSCNMIGPVYSKDDDTWYNYQYNLRPLVLLMLDHLNLKIKEIPKGIKLVSKDSDK